MCIVKCVAPNSYTTLAVSQNSKFPSVIYCGTTDIQVVVNCFIDCRQFINNTKISGDIAWYLMSIFRLFAIFDLAMICLETVTDTCSKVNQC